MKTISNSFDYVIEEVEASDAGLRLVTCQQCGFRFDATHEDDGKPGQWSCPACQEGRLAKDLLELRQGMEPTTERANSSEPDISIHRYYSNILREVECRGCDYGSTFAGT